MNLWKRMHLVFEGTRSTPAGRAVLQVLAHHWNPNEGCARPGMETLARYSGLRSHTTLRKVLRDLEALGEIYVERTAGGARETNRYFMNFDLLEENSKKSAEEWERWENPTDSEGLPAWAQQFRRTKEGPEGENEGGGTPQKLTPNPTANPTVSDPNPSNFGGNPSNLGPNPTVTPPENDGERGGTIERKNGGGTEGNEAPPPEGDREGLNSEEPALAERCREIWPHAPAELSPRERTLWSRAVTELRSWEEETWTAVRAYLWEAPERVRRRPLYEGLRSRVVGLGKAGEIREEALKWWHAQGGRRWWKGQQSRAENGGGPATHTRPETAMPHEDFYEFANETGRPAAEVVDAWRDKRWSKEYFDWVKGKINCQEREART